MGWILEFIGVFVGSAVVPIKLAVMCSHVSPYYITYAPPAGSLCDIATWLGVSKGMYGAVNIDTTFENWSMFTGCLVSLMVPVLIWICMRPFVRTPYNWDHLLLMIPLEPREGDISYTYNDNEELGIDWDPQELVRASKMVKIVSGVLCLIFLIIIPFPLYGTGYIMSRNFFTAWTVVVFNWSWCAALLIWLMPIWQSRGQIVKVAKGAFGSKMKGVVSGHHTEVINGAEVQQISKIEKA